MLLFYKLFYTFSLYYSTTVSHVIYILNLDTVDHIDCAIYVMYVTHTINRFPNIYVILYII